MFKVKVCLLIALPVILFCAKAYSSDSTAVKLKRNVAFTTFGGKENFASMNYERIFSASKKVYWSYSIGAQPFQPAKKLSVPVSLNAFTSGRTNHFEVNLTATFYMDKFHPYNGGWKEDFNKQLYLNPSICYRFQGSGPIVFKTGIGPKFLFDPPSDDIMKFKTVITFPSAFVSVGVDF